MWHPGGPVVLPKFHQLEPAGRVAAAGGRAEAGGVRDDCQPVAHTEDRWPYGLVRAGGEPRRLCATETISIQEHLSFE